MKSFTRLGHTVTNGRRFQIPWLGNKRQSLDHVLNFGLSGALRSTFLTNSGSIFSPKKLRSSIIAAILVVIAVAAASAYHGLTQGSSLF